MNQDLRLDASEARALSPLFWPAAARAAVRRGRAARTNRASSCARAARSRTTWGKAGVATRYEEFAGANHFTVIDPLADPQSAMVARLAELARRA